MVDDSDHEGDDDDSDADHDGNSDDDSVESVIVMIVTNSVMVILTVLKVMWTLMDLAGTQYCDDVEGMVMVVMVLTGVMVMVVMIMVLRV